MAHHKSLSARLVFGAIRVRSGAKFGVRYANRWLELKPRKTTIELASIKELVPALNALLQAVRAGELDGVLAKAAVA